jgi:hypothetical protein
MMADEKFSTSPGLDFHEWYMENYDRLHESCMQQTDEPPFKDVYLFAQAAWNAAKKAEESQTHSFAPSDWGATGEHCRVCSEPCNAPIHQKGVKS